MAVAHDTYVASGNSTTTITQAVTPTGTPRGVKVYVSQISATDDQVTGVTYGGVAMTRVPTHGFVSHTTAGDTGATYAYFLGSSIPTGTQNVVVSVTAGAATKIAIIYVVTAAADTEIVDADSWNLDSTSAPRATLSLGGRTSYATLAGFMGRAVDSECSPLTDWNRHLEAGTGSGFVVTDRYTVIGSTDITAGVDQTTADDFFGITFAISEVSAGGTNIKAISNYYRRIRSGR